MLRLGVLLGDTHTHARASHCATDFFYYQRHEAERQYPIYCRRRGSPNALEQVLLDVNELAKGQAFFALAKEARAEIRKVVWPTRQETTQTTLIVVAVVLVMALLLWGLDTLLGWLVSMIVG